MGTPRNPDGARPDRLGTLVDAWTPRLLKLLGLGGFALSLVLAGLGAFNPVLLGASLTAASGGFVGDALKSSKAVAEAIKGRE